MYQNMDNVVPPHSKPSLRVWSAPPRAWKNFFNRIMGFVIIIMHTYSGTTVKRSWSRDHHGMKWPRFGPNTKIQHGPCMARKPEQHGLASLCSLRIGRQVSIRNLAWSLFIRDAWSGQGNEEARVWWLAKGRSILLYYINYIIILY